MSELLTVPEAAALLKLSPDYLYAAVGRGEPCRCAVCLALLELAASADRNLRRRMAERRARVGRAERRSAA